MLPNALRVRTEGRDICHQNPSSHGFLGGSIAKHADFRERLKFAGKRRFAGLLSSDDVKSTNGIMLYAVRSATFLSIREECRIQARAGY
jgi:hypothetical protein